MQVRANVPAISTGEREDLKGTPRSSSRRVIASAAGIAKPAENAMPMRGAAATFARNAPGVARLKRKIVKGEVERSATPFTATAAGSARPRRRKEAAGGRKAARAAAARKLS
jgi:hypothetical protein